MGESSTSAASAQEGDDVRLQDMDLEGSLEGDLEGGLDDDLDDDYDDDLYGDLDLRLEEKLVPTEPTDLDPYTCGGGQGGFTELEGRPGGETREKLKRQEKRDVAPTGNGGADLRNILGLLNQRHKPAGAPKGEEPRPLAEETRRMVKLIHKASPRELVAAMEQLPGDRKCKAMQVVQNREPALRKAGLGRIKQEIDNLQPSTHRALKAFITKSLREQPPSEACPNCWLPHCTARPSSASRAPSSPSSTWTRAPSWTLSSRTSTTRRPTASSGS